MPSTYTLISSTPSFPGTGQTLFSSIPNTYTDLVLRFSCKTNSGIGLFTQLGMTFNSATTNYSDTILEGNGTSVSTSLATANAYLRIGGTPASSSGTLTDVWGNGEIYIPNYTVSANKPVSTFVVSENAGSAAQINTNALLWNNTAAITSILIYTLNASNTVFGTSFYLYGIKNS
jgi:hypothetical protein